VTPTLGLLDLGWVEPPRTHAQVVHDTIELAPIAESFGYARYWLAEHHSHWVAHASPEILLLLAGLTTNLRVGTAGVLLGYYSPYKVAANCRLLEALFPGRIDLGIARGLPDGNAGPALLDGRPAPGDTAAHAQRVDELLLALRGQSDPPPSPLGVSAPEVWLLGSGRDSVRVAAQRGTSFSLALFFRQWMGPDVLSSIEPNFARAPSRLSRGPISPWPERVARRMWKPAASWPATTTSSCCPRLLARRPNAPSKCMT
jgi:luciferase family oxidoreductase group 1